MSLSAPYTITELLSGGGRVTLYRAIRNADGCPVVLKVLDPRNSRPTDLEHIKHEYEIGRRFDKPTVVKSLALETYQGMPALVLEDFGGRSLSDLLGAPMAVERFLPLAVEIAEAVCDIHQEGIVHKDLKPANILVNPTTGNVKLGDFGLASRSPREQPIAEPLRLIEGSLPYLSPEQTGRTTRVVDSRADLYALGVTFHQMLTGRLPFEAKDPMEWVHCHVARTPPSVSVIVPEVPEILARIVLKLLSKMPEDRYQSARGLQLDLERCLASFNTSRSIDPFPLGERDATGRLQIPQKLYGRDAEIALLLDAFGRVADTGAPELLLVSGYSGIGKSTLVRVLEEPTVRAKGFFISGKFDQYKRNVPYATLVQAFRELVLEILTQSAERIAAWRQRLLEALGINGQLIVEVIPQVELVIGKQPPTPELPPVEAQNRFRLVFRRFIGVFAQKEHPLALFLDDLQWADSASLGVLEDLVAHAGVRHLLVVGAYRENEVTPAHLLMLSVDEMRKGGGRVSEIVLGPIPHEALVVFVGDVLRCRRGEAEPIADLLRDKTAGNPFFVIQFLTALHDEGLIVFDVRAGRFRWDVAKIFEKGFTDNVVDLMVGKMRRLPAATQEALKQLACLGNSAEVAILTIVHGGSEEDTHGDLWEAVGARLILRQNDSYRFFHDRIQEAAYSLVPEASRAEMHLGIGRLLSSRLSAEAIAERVFDVVNQWNRGAHLLTDPHEKEVLYKLDVLAGTKAKASIAHASAQSCFAQASALLPEDAWSRRYEDTFALHLDLAECEYLLGSFQRADALFDLILQRTRSPLDRAKATRLRMRLYQMAGRHRDAVSVMIEAVRLFGINLPESDDEIQAEADAELQRIPILLRGRAIADIARVPASMAPRVRAILDLLVEAMAPVYIARPAYWTLIIAKGLRLSLEHGSCDASAFVYSCYAIMLVSMYGNIPWALQFSEMSIRLNETFDGMALEGKLLLIHGAQINIWCRRFATSLPVVERAFAACLNVGDFVFAGYASYNLVWLLVENGDPLDHVIEASRTYAAFAKESHNDAVYRVVRTVGQFAASLKGTTVAPACFSDGDFDEAECVLALEKAGFGVGVAYHHIMKQVSAFIHGRYAEARQAAARAAPMLREVMAMANEATHHFYYALTLTALYPDAIAEEQQQFAGMLEVQLRKLSLWAEHCPESFQNRHALVAAEVARIEGRDLEAMRLYEEAIRSARENGFVQNEALAYEIASRFYRARGFDEIAETYLRNARSCYARWGADGKVAQIDHQHPRLVEPRTLAPTATVAVRPVELDLYAVTKASQTISGEIVLDKLLCTLLEVVLEQGGAQRACLVLCRDERLSIEAEATLEDEGVVTTVLRPVPVSSSERIPTSLVRYAQRTRERVILSDAASGAGKFAGDDYFARARPKSVLCMPILRQAEVVGLLYLENNLLAGAFTPERLVALSLCATQAAISLENALLLQRAAFLAEAGEILSASLDYEQTLSHLEQLCVRSLCDWCVIDVVEGEEIRRISGAHADPAKEPLLRELSRRYPPRWGSPHPAAEVLKTGAPLLFPELPDERIRALAADDEHVRLSRALGAQSSLIVPLVARGQTIGALSMVSGTRGHFGRADLELAEEVARRAATSIDNARLYRASQEAVRARNEFLTVASHELNTPVTSLMLALSSLRRATASGRPVDAHVMDKRIELASRQGTRLTRLINDLLDVSRVEAGPLALELTDVDLDALVREVIERFKDELSQSRCRVTVHASAPLVGRWDRARLDRVVMDLLSNAIKFGAGKPIEIFLDAERGIARLAVRDHGIGIEREQRDRIFGRFERAVSERHYGGLGLGLYISRRIVEDHGGTIRCDSRLGAGTTFTVELPCAGPP
ncbi:Signal transduction histidine kinase CheA [Minicystis rosea]|nr:Signal transduction histidine kinase CheA [Minicystis rosea]